MNKPTICRRTFPEGATLAGLALLNLPHSVRHYHPDFYLHDHRQYH
jgi:hypothetical protein